MLMSIPVPLTPALKAEAPRDQGRAHASSNPLPAPGVLPKPKESLLRILPGTCEH